MNKKLIWGIIIVAVVAGGIYWINKMSYKATPLVTETDWKTYTNTQVGYELKYPSNWKIEENLGASVRIFNPARQGKPDTDVPREEVVLSLKQMNTCQSKDWNVGFGLVNYKTACLSTASKYIQVDMTAVDDSMIIEDRILSTFKFISPNVDEISNAKLFLDGLQKNLGINYEIKNSSKVVNFWINNNNVQKNLNGFSMFFVPDQVQSTKLNNYFKSIMVIDPYNTGDATFHSTTAYKNNSVICIEYQVADKPLEIFCAINTITN
jgi:hypothetical protein